MWAFQFQRYQASLEQRNGLWIPDVTKYVAQVLDSCKSCIAVQELKGFRPVSVSSMSREFNQVVCVDHFFIDDVKVFHAMYASSRYSFGAPAPDTSMTTSIEAFEAH